MTGSAEMRRNMAGAGFIWTWLCLSGGGVDRFIVLLSLPLLRIELQGQHADGV